ncbi:MAG: tRNA (adenosine(37)-N6)-threonylcarbamoyltransferase complex transferase subunit TsaD [Candidatus Doudnabacteria bacterium]
MILAIETSCDETAAAVLEVTTGGKWPEITPLSSIVNSQIKLHSKMGGVVPEVAARAHVKNIRPVVTAALQATSYKLPAIDYIAITAGPGLIPSLIVGVEFAKALSLATGKPLIPVNHMLGHLYSPLGREFSISNFQFPMIALIVSGGHTILVLMENEKKYKVLGQTVDDAAGEAFDKVAKLLGLPYPGGPEVSRLALKGNSTAINFPRPMLHAKNYDFSFSGLKTAVLYHVRSLPTTSYSLQTKSDICASFQAAAVDVLVQKTMRAVKQFNAKSVSLSGGVAANKLLRSELIVNCQKLNVEFMAPPMNLCTDNAEMIGIAAAFMLQNGFKPVSYKKVKADSNLHL